MAGHDESDATTFEAISKAECLQLLATQVIGRVAVAEFNAAPLVVPVNFVLDGEDVLFRTDYGTKFRRAVLGEQPVSFEVDAVDPGRRSGWSVLVQGDATEADVSQLGHLSLEPWAPGAKEHWVRLTARTISGRRIQLTYRPADARGYL
jgi:nitroimidazol reductase NimA-like FMN-containing flavoprotein (pyridoxamine 5'-phosphate oxidase superfamily)